MKKAFWIVLVAFTLSVFGSVPAMAAQGHGKAGSSHHAAKGKRSGHGKKHHKKHKAAKKHQKKLAKKQRK